MAKGSLFVTLLVVTAIVLECRGDGDEKYEGKSSRSRLATRLEYLRRTSNGKHADAKPAGHIPRSSTPGWTLLWSDEFDTLDDTKWSPQMYDGYQYGVGDWGNAELSWYSNRSQNLRVENGSLVLQAQLESGADLDWVFQNCWDECRDRCTAEGWTGTALDNCIQPCGYPRCDIVKARALTSARVRTYGKFSVAPSAQYSTVRVEASMALPQGSGLWPAFWMLPEVGANDSCSGCGMYGSWASSGEIDIMESVNGMANVFGTVHYGGAAPSNVFTSASASNAAAASGGFQQFAVEWEQSEMRWYQGNSQYANASSRRVSPQGWFSASPSATPDAPFDVPFHLLINLAVGGTLPSEEYSQRTGQPLDLSAVQQAVSAGGAQLRIDYVRVCGKPAGA